MYFPLIITPPVILIFLHLLLVNEGGRRVVLGALLLPIYLYRPEILYYLDDTHLSEYITVREITFPHRLLAITPCLASILNTVSGWQPRFHLGFPMPM